MNLGVTTIRGHLWLAYNLKEKFLTRRQLSWETCLFGSRWWKRRMKAQGWAALPLSANDPHCWLQPTPRHTYSEACETEPSWDPQIRGSRCDEEPGACYIWELGSMLTLFPSPLPPSLSLCVRGCDTTWYTKSTVLFCVFLCTTISNLLALSTICWGLSMLMRVALVCSFHSHESSMTSGHTYISADRSRLLICWKCKWSSYKKPRAQQQNISGASTKEGNFGVLEYTGCHMALFPNHSDLLSP